MHAVLSFSALPLFLGALLSDWAYARSHEIQWTNFAAWLVAGGLVFVGLALLLALIDTVRSRSHRTVERPGGVYLLLLLATLVLGIVNALVHAKDGWAAMPMGLVLSAVVLVLAALAAAMGLRRLRPHGAVPATTRGAAA